MSADHTDVNGIPSQMQDAGVFAQLRVAVGHLAALRGAADARTRLHDGIQFHTETAPLTLAASPTALAVVKLGTPPEGYRWVVRNVSVSPSSAPDANLAACTVGVYVGTSSAAQGVTGSTVTSGELRGVFACTAQGGCDQFSNEQVTVKAGRWLYVAVSGSASADPVAVAADVMQIPDRYRPRGVELA